MVYKNTVSTRDIVLTGMFTAVIAVMSQLSIPMPSGVPITIQMFAITLCGVVLGWRLGSAAVLVYILIGALGAPVFANFGAGPGTIFGKTGGFILGYPFMTLLCGFSEKVKPYWQKLLFCIAGLLVCHLFGIFQYMLLTGMNFQTAALLMSLPYLLKDGILVVCAIAAGRVLRAALHTTEPVRS